MNGSKRIYCNGINLQGTKLEVKVNVHVGGRFMSVEALKESRKNVLFEQFESHTKKGLYTGSLVIAKEKKLERYRPYVPASQESQAMDLGMWKQHGIAAR